MPRQKGLFREAASLLSLVVSGHSPWRMEGGCREDLSFGSAVDPIIFSRSVPMPKLCNALQVKVFRVLAAPCSALVSTSGFN